MKVKFENEIILAQKGDEESLEFLIKNNNGLIWSLVKKFIGKGYETDDLYQIACIGFIKAVKRFNLEYKYQLSTFAVPYILGELKKFLRDDGIIKISRNIKELWLKIKEIENVCEMNMEEIPDASKMAQMLNVKVDDVIMALDSRMQVESINEEVFEDINKSKLEFLNVKEDEHSKLIDNLTIHDLVNELENREKQIINLRFFKEKTQAQVAKILGISQVQVSRIERKILDNMRLELCC